MHTCIHTYIRTCIHTYIHTHTRIHAYVRIYVRIVVHTYIHTYILAYMHACTHIHTYIHPHINIHIHICIHTRTHPRTHTYICSGCNFAVCAVMNPGVPLEAINSFTCWATLSFSRWNLLCVTTVWLLSHIRSDPPPSLNLLDPHCALFGGRDVIARLYVLTCRPEDHHHKVVTHNDVSD
jgi:hypothetical protein